MPTLQLSLSRTRLVDASMTSAVLIVPWFYRQFFVGRHEWPKGIPSHGAGHGSARRDDAERRYETPRPCQLRISQEGGKGVRHHRLWRRKIRVRRRDDDVPQWHLQGTEGEAARRAGCRRIMGHHDQLRQRTSHNSSPSSPPNRRRDLRSWRGAERGAVQREAERGVVPRTAVQERDGGWQLPRATDTGGFHRLLSSSGGAVVWALELKSAGLFA